MDPVYDQARSDAETILASLGVLANFARHAENFARAGLSMTCSKVENAAEAGGEMMGRAADALKTAREQLDTLLQDFGGYFNHGDGCSATMSELTAPVYALLAKRRRGISTND